MKKIIFFFFLLIYSIKLFNINKKKKNYIFALILLKKYLFNLLNNIRKYTANIISGEQ
jgi:hypothetical protein